MASSYAMTRTEKANVRSPSQTALLAVVLQPRALARVLQLRQRARLDLAHALAGDPHLGADRLERHGLLGGEPVAKLEHAALAPLQRLERLLEVGLADVLRHHLERRLL